MCGEGVTQGVSWSKVNRLCGGKEKKVGPYLGGVLSPERMDISPWG